MAATRNVAPRWSIARLFGKHGSPRGKKGFADSFMPFAGSRTFMVAPGSPVWMDRDYTRFAQEAYIRNVVAHRCIAMVAGGAACVRLKLFSMSRRGVRKQLKAHPLLDLLNQPNPSQAHASFMEAIYQYRLIAGNAFVQAVGAPGAQPGELHALRPDRVAVIAGQAGQPAAYRYTVNGEFKDYPIDPITWASRILHVKTFHPLNDWYGLSPVEAVAYSIDQHNQAGAWNQSLLQNGARPSGALVVKGADGQGGFLNEDQYYRLKSQLDEQFSGPANTGRPMLLEGGLDWKELSLSPKDMDFIQCKNASARDIALGFGVPPQMLGIPGDNTFSNLQEARLAMWEQTILPLTRSTIHAMSQWLSPMFGGGLEVVPDVDSIEALAMRNQDIWNRVQAASFLTTDEKRAAVGYPPLPVEAVPAPATTIKSARKPKAAKDDDGGDDGDAFSDGDGGDSGDYDDNSPSVGNTTTTAVTDGDGDSHYDPNEARYDHGRWTGSGTIPTPDGGNLGQGTQVADAGDVQNDAQPDGNKFDAQGAAQYVQKNAEPKSTGMCGHYVGEAIVNGGGLTDAEHWPGEAKDFGPWLEDSDFQAAASGTYISADQTALYPPAGYVPQLGDVAVIQPYPDGNPAGHVEMYTGSNAQGKEQWVSDFVQPQGFWPGPGYRAHQPSFTIYRYPSGQ